MQMTHPIQVLERHQIEYFHKHIYIYMRIRGDYGEYASACTNSQSLVPSEAHKQDSCLYRCAYTQASGHLGNSQHT